MSEANVGILSEGVGYGIVCGIGFAFALVMTGLTWCQHRYTMYKASADEFNTASRSVKPGLIASGIVSAWTWAATLLQSSSVGYAYGIAGPYWYAAGATVQVLLFAMLAVKVKQNGNGARTFLEIVRARYGTTTHMVYLCFALATNIIVSSMLLLGGSAVVNTLTGANIYAANFLIPVGVAFYVYFGGLRATLLCDWSHTTALFVIIMYFWFAFYTSSISDRIGSPSGMLQALAAASQTAPVSGNTQGSYLTMRSVEGIIFGVINVIGNFGTVFLDQVYFQRAIASKPETAVKGYLLGGLAWFAVPFTFATTMGLGAVALGANLSPASVSAGLAAPAAAALLLGEAGAVALLILLFMAVTSAASAEIIAVSSIATFDVYIPYVNPNATQEQITKCSHFGILGYAIFMGFMASMFHIGGVSLGWLYLWMGCVIGGGVVPLALTICWAKTNKTAATIAPVIALCCGIGSWLGATSALFNGEISIATSGSNYPMLTGNLVSIAVGGIVVLVGTLMKPDNYDWETTRSIGLTLPASNAAVVPGVSTEADRKSPILSDAARADLEKAFKVAATASVVLTFVLLILIPIPMFGAEYVMSEGFFSGWVIIAIIWCFLSAIAVVLYPIFESREALVAICRGIWLDMSTGGKAKQQLASEQQAANPVAMYEKQQPNSPSPTDSLGLNKDAIELQKSDSPWSKA